jgi:hypothetical protein
MQHFSFEKESQPEKEALVEIEVSPPAYNEMMAIGMEPISNSAKRGVYRVTEDKLWTVVDRLRMGKFNVTIKGKQ